MQGHEGSQVMAVLGAFKSERTLRTIHQNKCWLLVK
jgi:hypothetical protein